MFLLNISNYDYFAEHFLHIPSSSREDAITEFMSRYASLREVGENLPQLADMENKVTIMMELSAGIATSSSVLALLNHKNIDRCCTQICQNKPHLIVIYIKVVILFWFASKGKPLK